LLKESLEKKVYPEGLSQEFLFVTGYGKLALTSAAAKVYEAIVVAVTIDPTTSMIIEADSNLVTALGRDFLRNLLEGYCLEDGVEGLEERLEKRYHGSARRALVTALYNIYNRYVAYQKRASVEDLD
jgi:precorrin-3B methylase